MDFYFGVDLLHHLQKHYEQRLSLALSKSFNQTDSRYYWLFKELECRVTMLRKLLVMISALPGFMCRQTEEQVFAMVVSSTSSWFSDDVLGDQPKDAAGNCSYYQESNPYWVDYQLAMDRFTPDYDYTNLAAFYVDLVEYLVMAVRLYFFIREQYTCNPNAKWDWWQIGGRFPNRFLVPAGLQDCIPSAKDDDGESATHPEGYQYADAARKKDICWDVMRKIAVDTVEKRYQKCVRAFETKDLTDFGPLCRILDEGISAWGEMLYLKGETLDEYKARKGATDLDRYMCHTYAFVDRNGDWIGSGDMGWFGISSNDKDERAWNDEIQKLMNEAKDDDFLAIVDCHI